MDITAQSLACHIIELLRMLRTRSIDEARILSAVTDFAFPVPEAHSPKVKCTGADGVDAGGEGTGVKGNGEVLVGWVLVVDVVRIVIVWVKVIRTAFSTG